MTGHQYSFTSIQVKRIETAATRCRRLWRHAWQEIHCRRQKRFESRQCLPPETWLSSAPRSIYPYAFSVLLFLSSFLINKLNLWPKALLPEHLPSAGRSVPECVDPIFLQAGRSCTDCWPRRRWYSFHCLDVIGDWRGQGESNLFLVYQTRPKALEDHGMPVTVAPGSIQSVRLNRLGGIWTGQIRARVSAWRWAQHTRLAIAATLR